MRLAMTGKFFASKKKYKNCSLDSCQRIVIYVHLRIVEYKLHGSYAAIVLSPFENIYRPQQINVLLSLMSKNKKELAQVSPKKLAEGNDSLLLW